MQNSAKATWITENEKEDMKIQLKIVLTTFQDIREVGVVLLLREMKKNQFQDIPLKNNPWRMKN
uniref:Uncharacterized protein n=1 Tax=Octopus bimaculoides TaxID=37653 RepID=A0A0L8G7J8_OCTBM